MSYVYLLHFDRPISPDHTCQHYMGCTHDLPGRIRSHWLGNGARLVQVAHERGISFELARVWRGDFERESHIKARHEGPRLCPICNPDRAYCLEPVATLAPAEVDDLLIPF